MIKPNDFTYFTTLIYFLEDKGEVAISLTVVSTNIFKTS